MQNIDISKFENKRILVVGDIILDEFIHTSSNRNSPEYRQTPILKIEDKKHYLGGAANVALNIKKLNAIPYLIGTVGDDISSKIIYELLHKEDVTNLYVHTDVRQKTTLKSRIFKDGNPLFRMDDEAEHTDLALVNHFVLKQLTEAITNHKPHAIVLQDYNKGVLNKVTIPKILDLARQHHLLICVDPKFENWELYQQVDLFKPNLVELKVISDELLVEDKSIENISKALSKVINFKNLLLTLGADGNFIFNSEKSQFLKLNSQIKNPDVCGAGDTVIAVAALGLTCGFSLEETALLSNVAGNIVCQKENTQPVTFQELSSSIINL